MALTHVFIAISWCCSLCLLFYFYSAVETQLKWYDGTNVQYSNWDKGRPNVNSPFMAGLAIDNSWIIVSKPHFFVEFKQRSIVVCKLDNGEDIVRQAASLIVITMLHFLFCILSHPRTKRRVHAIIKRLSELWHVDLWGAGPVADLVPGSGRVRRAWRPPGQRAQR